MSIVTLGAFLLAACGGGGGGGEETNTQTGTPTPPPPPPEPVSFAELSSAYTFLSPLVAAAAVSKTFGVTLKEGSGNLEYDRVLDQFNLDLEHRENNSGGPLPETFGEGTYLSARSGSLFSVYATSDAEFALLEPGLSKSGYEYTTLALISDSQLGNSASYSGEYGYEAIVFGFPTTFSEIPTTGSADYRGAIVGNVSLSDGDVGSLNGPAKIEVSFDLGTVSGRFGGMASSSVLGTLRFTSYLTGQSGNLPDIVFDTSLSGSSNDFRGDIRFEGTSPFDLAGSLLTNPGGSVVGRFFGPSGNGGPPEIGGTLQVNNDLLTINAAFIAKQGGDAQSFAFAGVMPHIFSLSDIHRLSGTGVAAASVDGTAVRDDILASENHHKNIQWFGIGSGSLYPGLVDYGFDFSTAYRSNLSTANLLTFETSYTNFYGYEAPGLLSLDTADANRFGLQDVRFGLHSAIGPHVPLPDGATAALDFATRYFVFGNPTLAADLPRTGTAIFDGAALGQYQMSIPFEDGSALDKLIFDFLADVRLTVDFSDGDIAAIFSNYDIPAELIDYVIPEYRSQFSFDVTLDGSMNSFNLASNYRTPKFDGQFFETSGGGLEVGGTFTVPLSPFSGAANAPLLEVTGAYGASQSSLTLTGAPLRQSSGLSQSMGAKLIEATNGLSNIKSDTYFNHALAMTFGNSNTTATQGYFARRSNIFGSSSAVHDHSNIIVYTGSNTITLATEAYGVVDEGVLTFEFQAGDVAGATGNDTFALVEKSTSTGGEAVFVISNPGDGDFGLDYATLGIWAVEEPSGGIVTGSFAYGDRTPQGDVPTTGTATYNGAAAGVALETSGLGAGSRAGAVAGDASVGVDFQVATVTLDITNLKYYPTDQAANFDLPDISGSGSISGNTFNGQLGSIYGRFSGLFLGPAAPTPSEVAGVWQERVPDPTNLSTNLMISGVFSGN